MRQSHSPYSVACVINSYFREMCHQRTGRETVTPPPAERLEREVVPARPLPQSGGNSPGIDAAAINGQSGVLAWPKFPTFVETLDSTIDLSSANTDTAKEAIPPA